MEIVDSDELYLIFGIELPWDYWLIVWEEAYYTSSIMRLYQV